jgi:hypothetical protein
LAQAIEDIPERTWKAEKLRAIIRYVWMLENEVVYEKRNGVEAEEKRRERKEERWSDGICEMAV